jgi:hypothetical protein
MDSWSEICDFLDSRKEVGLDENEKAEVFRLIKVLRSESAENSTILPTVISQENKHVDAAERGMVVPARNRKHRLYAAINVLVEMINLICSVALFGGQDTASLPKLWINIGITTFSAFLGIARYPEKDDWPLIFIGISCNLAGMVIIFLAGFNSQTFAALITIVPLAYPHVIRAWKDQQRRGRRV